MNTTTFEAQMEAVRDGQRLEAADVLALASAPDLLPLGILADVARRRVHGTHVTYVRVAMCAFDGSFAEAVPPAAREVRISGAPPTLAIAVDAVKSARAIAGERAVSGFSWADVQRLSAADGGSVSRVLGELKSLGLEGLAEVALDQDDASPEAAIEALSAAGYQRIRMNILNTPFAARGALLIAADTLQQKFKTIQAINPLPSVLNAFRPTTGYEDVKTVAVARLIAPNISSIQLDWLRYGPKLAQVGLTFGADDLDGVDPSDEAPEGRRRAALEEVRRNIEAAGFEPVERDGRYNLVS